MSAVVSDERCEICDCVSRVGPHGEGICLPAEACRGWNWEHECGLAEDHVGDHECAGCGDVWNRGEWDDDPDDFNRPARRCTDRENGDQ